MKRRVVIQNTQYSLLISLVMGLAKDSTFLFPEGDISKNIIDNMKEEGIDVRVIRDSFKENPFIFYKERLKRFLELRGKDLEVYGNDHLDIAIPYRRFGMKLIEDGTLNYTFHESGYKNPSLKDKIKNLIRLVPSDKKCYGLDDRVKEIYLTGLAPIPKIIEKKVKLIDLKRLWKGRSEEERESILKIFSLEKDIEKKISGRDIILFTQPISEDRVISEEEKICIYTKIIEKYPADKLIIKTHPREKTDYKKIFKDILVLDKPFPFEVLNLLGVKFKKSVTLFSTAGLGLGKDVEVDFYGTEVHPKIFETFGSCDNIMKRNSFLEDNYDK